MAKKRKLAQNSTSVSNSKPKLESEPEPQSQPESEPIEEEQSPTAKTEPIEVENPNKDNNAEEKEESGSESGEEEDEQIPQNLENPSPNPEDSDPESIKKILELFPKEQLITLLRDAASKHPSILQEILKVADVDPSARKIFVHGLGWDTTAKALTDFFTQFGEIEDCKVINDKATGKSKGYAFILFKTRKGAENALKEPQKMIGNRMAVCQLASLGPVPPPAPPVSEYTQRKIFVSNVATEIDVQKLTQFFGKYGEIEEGPLGLDKLTGKPRGFCLFVYKTVESAKKALEEANKNFEGHVLHCQKAVDRQKQNKQGFQFQQGFVPKGPKKNFAGGHLMAPSASGLGYNQNAVQPAAPVGGLNPALNQAALTALLASQGVGGIANLLGGLGSAAAGPVVNQGMPGQMVSNGMQGGYVSGYGGQAPVQGGYGGGQIGQGGGVRGPQGYGHAGGGPPYLGHH